MTISTWIRRGFAAASALSLLISTVAPVTAQDIVLKLSSFQKGQPGFGEWWDALNAAFEQAHPGVKVQFVQIPQDSYADTMTALFAAGNPPDIVHIGTVSLAAFAENGWLADLGPWIEKSNLDLDGWAGQDGCVREGTTVCIMLLYFGYVMAYNEQILNEEGLAPPTTYDEFIAAARKTTKDTNGDGLVDQWGTGVPLSSGGGAGANYVSGMLSFVFDTGARFTSPEGEVTIDTPEMIEGLTRWKTIVSEGLTPRDLGFSAVRQLLVDGKIAMEFEGPWIYPIMQQARPEVRSHLKLAEVPFTVPVGGMSNMIAMPTNLPDDRKELVWEYILLATSNEFQTKYGILTASPAPSPRTDVAAIEAKVPHYDLIIDAMMAAAAANINRTPTGLEENANEFFKMVMEECQRMISEDLDPAQTAQIMQKRAEEIQAH